MANNTERWHAEVLASEYHVGHPNLSSAEVLEMVEAEKSKGVIPTSLAHARELMESSKEKAPS